MPRSIKIPKVRLNLKVNPPDPNSKKGKNQKKYTKQELVKLRKIPSLVYAVFRYNGFKLKYSTGEKVIPKEWDNKLEEIENNPAFKDYQLKLELNERLISLKKIITKIFIENNYGDISTEDFKLEIDKRTGKASPRIIHEIEKNKKPSFFEFLKDYIKLRKESPTISRGTWKVEQTCYNHLIDYASNTDYIVDFDSLDWKFRKSFENWMYNKKNHSINYAAKMITTLTQFLNEAGREGLYDSSITESKGWHIKKKPTMKFALTFDELEQLVDYDFTQDERLERIRDLFIIASYSGMRYSDFSRITPEHIIIDEGIELIEIMAQKTDEYVTIPLFPELKSMLIKYEFNPPKPSNQKFNDYIKEVCHEVGLNRIINYATFNGGKRKDHSDPVYKIVASHVGRRSFCTNFSLLGIPAINLMKISGHSTESQFMKYICVDNRQNAIVMSKLISEKMAERRKLKVV